MAVFRVHKTENYTVMSNHHLRNMDLSLSARGLLSTILSLPPDWKYSIRGLASICKEGERAVKSALDELKQHGYVVVTRIEPREGNNRVSYEYDIFETPDYQHFLEKPQVSQACGCEGVHSEGVQAEGVQTSGLLNKEEITPISSSTVSLPDTEEQIKKEERRDFSEKVMAIIDYLNERLGTRYTYRNKTTNKLISARLSDGFTVDDFKTVIDNKIASWSGTEWEKYLTPNTLFAQSHFETYLNERPVRRNGSAANDFSEYTAAFGA